MRIEFIPSSEDVYDLISAPKPSKFLIPDWYKSIEPPAKKLSLSQSGALNNDTNIKNCMPFLDALSHGYIQTTWCDLNFTIENEHLNYYYAGEIPPIEAREKNNLDLNDYYPIEFVWKTPWITKMPKGYSLLFTHPLNRIDLPFTTLSGIIDGDLFHHTPFGRIPFYLKKGFQGTIAVGTPMFQILPIKRDEWTSKVRDYDDLENRQKNHFIRRQFDSVYKKSFWQKKNFN